MTLGGVARVAMEYRQHLAMLNNISKLSAAAATMSAVEGKAAVAAAKMLSSNGGDTFSCEFLSLSFLMFSFVVDFHSLFKFNF